MARQLFLAVIFVSLYDPRVTRAGFTDVTVSAGVSYLHQQDPGDRPPIFEHSFMTGGVAVADYDGDGFQDLFVTRAGTSDILFQNQGDGTFADVTVAANLDQLMNSNGAVWGDVDNDGDPDLYVTTVFDSTERFHLYVNDGGTFTEDAVNRGAAVPLSTHNAMGAGYSAAFGDYDNDGFIDLHTNEWGNFAWPSEGVDGPVGMPENSQARLLRNLGAAGQAGHFEDRTIAAGLTLGDTLPDPPVSRGIYSFSSRFADIDRDGHQDLVIAGDFGTSRIFFNDGDGTFTDATSTANFGTDENGMGLHVADYDYDGLLDVFITSIFDPDPNHPGNWGESGNRLYRNEGNRVFSDATDAAGVRDGGWGWGTSFLDYDNDGDLDLVMTNGIDVPTPADAAFHNDAMRFWENDGNGNFTEVSNAIGITDDGNGKGLAVFDYDNDGDLDIFVANHQGSPVLYQNDASDVGNNQYLRIDVEGRVSNRDGLGAWITVDPDMSVDGDEMYHEVFAGSNYLSQNEKTAHFGLGDLEGTVDLITIDWPSGISQSLVDVATNQVLDITEPQLVGDANDDGYVGAVDVSVLSGSFNGIGGFADGDFNGDGWVGAADVSALSGAFGEGIPPAIAAVPEPSAWLLLVSASLFLGLGRRCLLLVTT
ncbi:MAG: CRTAC1 family protein [Planctomycetota bacterium]